MLIFDAHLDLGMNAVQWNRDLTRLLEEIRAAEEGMTDKPDRGRGTVCLPEMRRGGVRLCVATQIGHCRAKENPVVGYRSPEIAWAQTQAQLAWYRTMEEAGWMRQIRTRADLDAAVEDVADDDGPIHYLLSLEGADSLVRLDYLDRAYEYGLRALGPAHYSLGRYAPGTGAEGPLEPAGRELIKQMDRLGMILDVTHLTDEAFWEALDLYQGPVWASHNNCRALVPHQRQLSDDMIRALVDRGSVIGAALDAWMMTPGWKRYETKPADVDLRLEVLVDHIGHVCQLSGNANHAGIGSDLDGGYGTEQTPVDLKSIADLSRLREMLAARGYSPDDIAGIMHGNLVRFLQAALPQ